jgi:methyl-accepting chemotaxis protein
MTQPVSIEHDDKKTEQKQPDSQKPSGNGLASPPPGLLTRRAYEQRIKTSLKKLSITAGPAANGHAVNGHVNGHAAEPVKEALNGESLNGSADTIHTEISPADIHTDPVPPAAMEMDDEPVLMLSPLNAASFRQGMLSRTMQIGGLFMSVFWVTICGFYIFDRYGAAQFSAMAPQELGAMLTGILAPVALLWIVISTIRRGNDVQMYAEALRGELQSLIFPTEERSRVVHRDIEALCRQAAELSASSKAVIKAIQRARLGLRTEIRDFVGISKKTEFHIDRLADTLHERADRLSILTEDIEQRTDGIGEKTREGVSAWDEVTQTILDRAGKMEAALSQGANKILEAATQASSKTQEIETHLDGSYKNLNATVEKIGQLEEKTSAALETMVKSGQIVQDQCAALDQSVGNMERQSGRIAETIGSSLTTLNGAADNIFAKTDMLETRITAQAGHLNKTVENLSGEASAIEAAGMSAAAKLGEAMRTALTGAETVGTAVRRAIESLEKSTGTARDQAEALMESSRNHIERLNNIGTGNIGHVQSMVSMLEESRTQIETASRLTDIQVKKLSAAVESQAEKITGATTDMVGRIESVSSAIADPLKNILHVVAEVDQKHEEIESTLRRRVTELNESSGKARESAEHIRDVLRGQVQEISALSGQIAGHSRTITEQMETQSGGLAEQVRKALADVELVKHALEAQAERLHSISETAVSDVSRLEGQIEGRSGEIGRVAEKAVSSMASLDDAMTGHVQTLKTQADQATLSVTAVREALDKTATGFEPLFTRAIEQADVAHERYERLRTDFDTTVTSNLDRFKQISSTFDERLSSLRQGADQAAHILRTSSEEMQERVIEIETASRSASEKMRDIQQSLDNQSSDIHLVTDQALLKIESIQSAINTQFHELAELVAHSMTRMEDVVGEIDKSVATVDTASGRIVARFRETGEIARDESQRLSESSSKSVQLASVLVAQVQSEAATLLQSSKDTLMELKKTGEALTLKVQDMAEQMKASLQTSQAYGSELRNQASMVADASATSADRISRVVIELRGHMDNVSTEADQAVVKIEQSRDMLSTESERLGTVSSTAIRAAEDVSAVFGRQSNALFKAVQEAAQHVDEIRKVEGRAQREAFLSSAKFIVESLHSLSVDLTRMIGREVPERTWKAFQKGDIGAFTRRLSQLGDDLKMDKLREKFAADNEFRTYVQRFIRQFEDMFDQAIANDYGELLASTFVSSDMGKLYGILCEAAGREAKFNREDKRVA